MGIIGRFKETQSVEMIPVVLHLNARLQPIHRGELFEDMLEQVLSQHNIGTILGGGTLQMPSGEISSCDIELNLRSDCTERFLSFLHRIDMIPKGSYITLGNKQFEIGNMEGLALYLNGTDLSAEVYQNSDINELIDLLDNAMENSGKRMSDWEGSRETALYYYGKSYNEMREKISLIIQTYPLCEKCRIEQIA